MVVEIVTFPTNSMVDLSIVFLVHVYQRVCPLISQYHPPITTISISDY